MLCRHLSIFSQIHVSPKGPRVTYVTFMFRRPGLNTNVLSSLGRLQDQLGWRRRERLQRLRRLPRNAKRIHQKSSKVAEVTREMTTTVEWKVEENDTVTIPCYGIDVRKYQVL
jgi:hypothetical protein